MAKNKYIFQLRRGTKIVDENGVVIQDDWAEYEAQENHKKPLAGELVLEYDNGIPRLKIGDGINEFSALPYMSVDSFILPKPTTITLYGGADYWKEDINAETSELIGYYQEITQNNIQNGIITKNSKIDLQPSPELLAVFHEKDVAFTVVNEDGNVKVYAVGTMPTNNYEIQCTITEVVIDG